jgi:hypothetical protein
MLQAMHDLERTWNHKFNYPWTFFNDVPFTEEFKKKTSAATNAETIYGTRTWKMRCAILATVGLSLTWNRNYTKGALGDALVDQHGPLS